MLRLNKWICAVSVVMLALAAPVHAQAASLKSQLSGLEVLSIPYGATNLAIAGRPTMVVRGNFTAQNKWGGDTYQILVQDGDVWKIAEYEPGMGAASLLEVRALATTTPHTSDDSVSSLRVMVPHVGHRDGNAKTLFLLRASRRYMMDERGRVDMSALATRVDFHLYELHRDDAGAVFQMHEVDADKTDIKYQNADCALLHELNVPPPSDRESLTCN